MDSFFVKRFIILFIKNIVFVRIVNKFSGGLNRNNDVLMEFYLNKVSISILISICKEVYG